jgi:hypothetical protein
MFSSLFSVLPALFFGLSSLVSAAPVQPVQLIAFAPTITYPGTGVTWITNTTQHVDWLTNNVPAEAQNYTVTILLGYLANNSENLDIKHPLATQIPIMQGTAIVTVPDVASGSNYTVAVIGDSGDVCPPFTITGP